MWSSTCILHRLISPLDMSITLLGLASRYPVLCQKLHQVFPLWSHPQSSWEIWLCLGWFLAFMLPSKLCSCMLNTLLLLTAVRMNWGGEGTRFPQNLGVKHWGTAQLQAGCPCSTVQLQPRAQWGLKCSVLGRMWLVPVSPQ